MDLLIGVTMSSDKSSRSNMFVGRSGNQRALIRAPDRKTFLIDWESLSSDKSS